MPRLRIDRLTAPPGTLVGEGGRVIVKRCHRADGLVARSVGLLGTPDLADDEALWIPRCGRRKRQVTQGRRPGPEARIAVMAPGCEATLSRPLRFRHSDGEALLAR